jgi:hypothetical protein
MVACNLFGGKEEEQETQKTNTQTPGGQIPGGEQPDGEQPGTDPNHDHVWGNWSVTTAATCSATGVETRTCALDSSHTETRDIAINPSAHNWIAKGIPSLAPTCETTGIGAKVCTFNPSHEDNDPNSVIPALGHDYGNWTQTTAPTCTAAGIETGTCIRDQVTTTRAIAINPNAHDWNTSYTTISTATVTADGIEAITCKHNVSHTKENRTLYATGTPGLAFEAIGSTAYRVRKGTVTSGVVHIPAYWRGNSTNYEDYMPVTEIGASNDSYIGAFSGIGITSITIPASVTSIGQQAFMDCISLTSVTILEGVTSISHNAFMGCTSLTNITIPASVTSIGWSVFQSCTSLTSITIPAGVMSISYGAFIGWTSSQTINVQGKADQAAADAAWGADWRNGCNATINYNGS